MAYSGDVSVLDAWAGLAEDKKAVLVDVRSSAEWSFVGIADLSSLGKSAVLIEWQSYPGMAVNGEFVSALSATLSQQGADRSTRLYFLCRSGGRSRAAAEAMTAAGYRSCFNVAGGFEGDLDAERHRGGISGWKVQRLPWVQG
jgi:rhodanese-related sulfurtransferase